MRWWRAGVAVGCVGAMLVVGGRFTFASMRAGSEATAAARYMSVEALVLDVDAKAAVEAGLAVPPAPGGATRPREVLAALESLGRVTRLAAPRLEAQDGETASLHIGDERRRMVLEAVARRQGDGSIELWTHFELTDEARTPPLSVKAEGTVRVADGADALVGGQASADGRAIFVLITPSAAR